MYKRYKVAFNQKTNYLDFIIKKIKAYIHSATIYNLSNSFKSYNMKASLLCFVAFFILLDFSFGQQLQFEGNYLKIGDVNAMEQLDNSNFVISGMSQFVLSQGTYLPLHPALQLNDINKEFIDSVSFPQFETIKLVHQRENGRVLCVVSDTVQQGYYFITLDRDLKNIIKNKNLNLDPDLRVDFLYFKETNGLLALHLKIRENSESKRRLIYYDPISLQIVSDEEVDFKYVIRHYLADSSLITVTGFNAFEGFDIPKEVIAKFDKDGNQLWEREYEHYQFNSVSTDDSGNIILAGKVQLPEDRYNAVIVKFNEEGHWLDQASVSVESNPQFWPNFNVSFNKMIQVQDKLICFGVDNYKSTGFAGSHNLIAAVYDFELNKLAFNRLSVGGIYGWITDYEIINEVIYGISNSRQHHEKYSFQFSLDFSELLVSTLEDTLDNNNYSIYPNPVTSELNLDLPNNSQISVIGLDGKLWYSNNYSPSINVSNWPTGVYFLRTNTNGDHQSFKFIKQ